MVSHKNKTKIKLDFNIVFVEFSDFNTLLAKFYRNFS